MALRFTPSDPQLEVEGVWTSYHGTRIKICRATKPAFVKEVRENRNGGIRIPDKRYARIIADHLLVDWNDEDVGEAYSKDRAVEVLTEDPDFRIFVEQYASLMDNYIRREGSPTRSGLGRWDLRRSSLPWFRRVT